MSWTYVCITTYRDVMVGFGRLELRSTLAFLFNIHRQPQIDDEAFVSFGRLRIRVPHKITKRNVPMENALVPQFLHTYVNEGCYTVARV